jgi:hypothetical protein
VAQRVQAVAGVGSRLVAADGVAQRGPRGVGSYRCRPVAQDPGEKVRLADGLTGCPPHLYARPDNQ